ncbi:MAG: T9SS type A sorting domain-containing protein [Melioribacteraceae bacterium]|nr:T9SS type A sorting domain-containing protein [Melioribacteraceae bacterium]
MIKSRLTILLFFVILLNTANAETYYINKKTGNDSNSGLSPNEAWENVEKTNDFSFAPGDSVLFSRGSTWNFTLLIKSSGVEGNLIYYGAYGEGRKPTFDMLFYNKRGALIARNQKYVKIENMVFKNTNGNPPNHANGVHFKYCDFFIVKNIEVYGAGNFSIGVMSGSSNFLLDSCIAMNGKSNGIILGYGHDGEGGSNSIVQNSYVSRIRWNDNFVLHQGDGSTSEILGENFILRNNYAEYSLGEEGFDITSGTNILLDNNITNSNRQGAVMIAHSAKNVTIKNHIAYADNKVRGAGRFGIYGLGDVTFKGNLVFGYKDAMMVVNTKDVTIKHNTFIWEDVYGDGISISWDADTVTFKNNILTTADEFYGRISVKDNIILSDKARYDFDNNMYFGKWPDFVYGSTFYNLYTWRSTFNQDSNSVVQDPYLFDKANGDFTLSDSSWAIDNADSSDRYGEVDMLGTTIPYGAGADIGAFEFKPGVVFTPPATPASPDNLALEMLPGGKLKLSWDDNSDNEFGFQIWRAVSDESLVKFKWFLDDEEFEHLDFTEVDATEFIDSTATSPLVEYRYRVKALNNRGNSGYTNIVEFTTGTPGIATYEFEAENYDLMDPADVDTTYSVVDSDSASGGKALFISVKKTKGKRYVGYSFDATSSDTEYHVWIKTRAWNGDDNASTMKQYVNWSIPDSIIERGGPAFPFQAMTYHAYTGDTLQHKWYLLSDAESAEITTITLAPGPQNFFFRSRAGRNEVDKIKITNDLDWRPNMMVEVEAESGSITDPLVIEAYQNASMDSAVVAPIGSGTVAQSDLLKGNDDINVKLTQAPDDYYVWLLVDLPNDNSNSYWIGKGDEQITPPSWEGNVTTGLEWRRIENSGVPKVFSFTPGAWHTGEILRVKQQEEGTTIDKILVTNDIAYMPDTVVSVGGTGIDLLPKTFTVSQNYPNPFNPSTVITYTLPKAGDVEINIYTVIGEKVTTLVNEHQSAGNKKIEWNAGNMSSGIYFYSVKYGDKVKSMKMLLLK